MSSKPLNLASDFVVLNPNHAATPVTLTPTIYEQLDQNFNQFKGHLLISSFSFDADWPTWEIHPAGDETVILLSGQATLLLETEDGEQAISLEKRGSYVIVPKGTWHTARTSTPTQMLFITPGEGTENREI